MGAVLIQLSKIDIDALRISEKDTPPEIEYQVQILHSKDSEPNNTLGKEYETFLDKVYGKDFPLNMPISFNLHPVGGE